MSSKNKRIKKVRKLKIKNIIIALFILIIIIFSVIYILNMKIKNIYIIGNNILSDKIIIEEAKLIAYPSFILTKSKDIKQRLLKDDYIKEVKITKKFNFKLYIEIKENKILASKDNKLVLENKKIVDNIYNITNAPILINNIDSVKDDFCKYFAHIDSSILNKISQIEYTPNNVDKSRFLLYMNDGNSVYITLTRIDKINKYNSIKDQLGNNLGILYLDSGDYYEIKNN